MRDAPVVGVDIGGTSLRAVTIGAGATVDRELRMERPEHADRIVEGIVRLATELVPGGPGAVGVGCAGLVDRLGVVRTSPNIAAFVEFPLREQLGAALGVPVVVDNDANAAAFAELTSGAAVGVSTGVFVAFGTGIGAAVIRDGGLARGENGFAGEVGHMRIVPDGPECVCGRRGCWEQMASGTALARMARSAAATGDAEAIRVAAGEVDAIRSEHVAAMARDGDPVALSLLDEVARWIGVGVEALVLTLDPGVVVIGGGLVEIGPPFFAAVRREIDATMIERDHRPAPAVVPAAYGDIAGALGAAMLARSVI
ncbi:MAG: ROK family protein [Acidimicrobiales bacterium]